MDGWSLLFKSVETDVETKSDLLIVFTHWQLLHAGLKCLGLGDDKTLSELDEESEEMPTGWNMDKTTYSLRYKYKKHVFVLIGTVVEEGMIINLLNGTTLALSNIELTLDQTVNSLRGRLSDLMPNFGHIITRLQTELIEPVFIGGREMSPPRSHLLPPTSSHGWSNAWHNGFSYPQRASAAYRSHQNSSLDGSHNSFIPALRSAQSSLHTSVTVPTVSSAHFARGRVPFIPAIRIVDGRIVLPGDRPTATPVVAFFPTPNLPGQQRNRQYKRGHYGSRLRLEQQCPHVAISLLEPKVESRNEPNRQRIWILGIYGGRRFCVGKETGGHHELVDAINRLCNANKQSIQCNDEQRNFRIDRQKIWTSATAPLLGMGLRPSEKMRKDIESYKAQIAVLEQRIQMGDKQLVEMELDYRNLLQAKNIADIHNAALRCQLTHTLEKARLEVESRKYKTLKRKVTQLAKEKEDEKKRCKIM